MKLFTNLKILSLQNMEPTGRMEALYLNTTRTEEYFAKAMKNLVDTDFAACWIFFCNELNTHKSETLGIHLAGSIIPLYLSQSSPFLYMDFRRVSNQVCKHSFLKQLGNRTNTGYLKYLTNKKCQLDYSIFETRRIFLENEIFEVWPALFRKFK